MATRKIRNTVILVALQGVIGTPVVPTGADNAILITEMSITPLDSQNIERAVIRGSFGANAELVGTASVKCTIGVELAGSGDAAVAPAWGKLLQACAFAESLLDTPDRVEYLPVSANLKAATIYYFDDGVLHKLFDAMGNVTLSAKVGERPMLKFEFTGIDGAMTAVPNAVPDYTDWQQPVAMTKANVIDITLGATYADGELDGGIAYPSNGLEINLNNEVSFNANLTNETVDITDRKPSGSVEFELTAAQEVAFMGNVKTNTPQSMGFTIGLVEGNRVLVHALAMPLTNPKKVDVKGVRYCGYDTRFLPVAGNDELRLVCL